jgi:hypothetical protein
MSIDEYIETSSDALFHYTKVSIAIEDILHTKKFKLSLLKDTNDPNEYKFKFFNIMGDSLDRNFTPNRLNEACSVINRKLGDECRVMSFCTNTKPTLILSDDSFLEDEHVCSKGWNKSRMWSQYGQNHYGICLVFSKEELEKVLRESKIKNYKAGYVQYSQQAGRDFEAITLNGNRLEDEGVKKYSFNHIMENSEQFFFRKDIDYRDEAEFRVVIFDPDKNLECLDVSSFIKCVIVGDKTSEAYHPLIIQMCKGLNIKSRKAYWDRGQFYLLPLEEEISN